MRRLLVPDANSRQEYQACYKLPFYPLHYYKYYEADVYLAPACIVIITKPNSRKAGKCSIEGVQRPVQEHMTRSGKHLTRWSGMATILALAATMVVCGCQKKGDGRKLSQSIEYSKMEKLAVEKLDQHQQHRRTGIQGGLWSGVASVFASVQRPNQTAEADPTNSTSSYNNASDTSNSTVDSNHSAIDSNHSASVPIYFGPLNYVGHSGRWYARYPLGVCEGDCDTDGKIIDHEHYSWGLEAAFLNAITSPIHIGR
jgi:hypothetical protein